MNVRGHQAGDRMRRQLAQQHKQQEQQQEEAGGRGQRCGRDLPDRQDQARRSEPTAPPEPGAFGSDQ